MQAKPGRWHGGGDLKERRISWKKFSIYPKKKTVVIITN
jgi:hypothetical protein